MSMEFKLGEKVVYPNHGVGVIEQISYGTANGRSERFYMLKIVSSGLKVMVPQTNVDCVGLRPDHSQYASRRGDLVFGEGPFRFAPRLETPVQGKLGQDADGIADGSSRGAERPRSAQPDQATFVPGKEDAGTSQVSSGERTGDSSKHVRIHGRSQPDTRTGKSQAANAGSLSDSGVNFSTPWRARPLRAVPIFFGGAGDFGRLARGCHASAAKAARIWLTVRHG